ncbi:hypothetical protein L1987_02093 [Smallanthus sonchifolius]|uniref:Uncharacterized protein n=1 Tax=Smallanthus sonchifolius TaxID=185202 RepID=A0ACB9K6W1_9ASTR|nr:hypothetical protein L1987_02093 [Smallanthus sonchifolius]
MKNLDLRMAGKSQHLLQLFFLVMDVEKVKVLMKVIELGIHEVGILVEVRVIAQRKFRGVIRVTVTDLSFRGRCWRRSSDPVFSRSEPAITSSNVTSLSCLVKGCELVAQLVAVSGLVVVVELVVFKGLEHDELLILLRQTPLESVHVHGRQMESQTEDLISDKISTLVIATTLAIEETQL